LIALCIERAASVRTVHDAARALGVNRKTLFNRVAADNLPCPTELVAWCRLIAATQILDDPGRTVERVGMSLGFGCGGGLRNMFRRYTGMSPSEIRDRGGPRVMAGLFRDFLTRARATRTVS
jgi:AraC-like DNA-binding protein